jgi:hypothetical protein
MAWDGKLVLEKRREGIRYTTDKCTEVIWGSFNLKRGKKKVERNHDETNMGWKINT